MPVAFFRFSHLFSLCPLFFAVFLITLAIAACAYLLYVFWLQVDLHQLWLVNVGQRI